MRWAAVLAISLAVQVANAQPQPGFPRKAALTAEETVARFKPGDAAGLSSLWKALSLRPVMICNSDCTAGLFSFNDGRRAVPDKIVRLAFDYRNGSRLLYFRDGKILGVVDQLGDYYDPPDVTMETGGLFSLRSHPRIGTGITWTMRSYFRADDTGVHPEVSVIDDCMSEVNSDIAYLFWTKRLPTIEDDEHHAVFLYYSAISVRDADFNYFTLLDDTRHVVYSRKSLNLPMKFDPVGSDLSADDLQKIYFYVPPTRVHFVRFYLKELIAISRGKDAKKKTWLRDYLKTVGDTPEKRQVLAALGMR